jgi:hypothetical protein
MTLTRLDWGDDRDEWWARELSEWAAGGDRGLADAIEAVAVRLAEPIDCVDCLDENYPDAYDEDLLDLGEVRDILARLGRATVGPDGVQGV